MTKTQLEIVKAMYHIGYMNNGRFKVEATHKEIGNIIGKATTTVNQNINKLIKEGILDFDHYHTKIYYITEKGLEIVKSS